MQLGTLKAVYRANITASESAAMRLRPVYPSKQAHDGASRARTGGLLVADQALSQLSYSPE